MRLKTTKINDILSQVDGTNIFIEKDLDQKWQVFEDDPREGGSRMRCVEGFVEFADAVEYVEWLSPSIEEG